VIDVARRKGKTFVELKRLSRDKIAFRKWTEDMTLQGNRDRKGRRRRRRRRRRSTPHGPLAQ
jgi:hypothetical protein